MERREERNTGNFDKDFDRFKNEIRALFQTFEEKIDKKLNKIEEKFSCVFDELKKEVNVMKDEVVSTREEMAEIKKKVNEIESSVAFQAESLEESVDVQNSKVEKIKFEMDEMKNKLLLLEKQERKYNLLFYGFQEDEEDNLQGKMKTFFIEKLKINEERVNKMLFSSCHRIPSEANGPKPVIIRFATFEDRDLIYSKFLSPVLREEKKRILTDLPLEMKKIRASLAKEAYKIRQKEKLKTRIVEKGTSVFLEVRKSKTESWRRREITL